MNAPLIQPLYDEVQHGTWSTLYRRQRENLEDKGARLYLEALDRMESLTEATIPLVDQMSSELRAATGWELVIVPGLIPVDDFFALLAQRQFCTSTWVRRPDQLDYLEEPDMFHDTFGHVPPLLDPEFALFMQRFGQIGVDLRGDEKAVLALQRLYWFFVEFGFVEEKGMPRAFGAGIMSSFGETHHAWDLRADLRRFTLEGAMSTPFTTTEIQSTYFLIKDIPEVVRDLEAWHAGLS
ncbi:MAG: phenylalanine-4-hydroxylase [Flavobacteriales bacterium]|nr:phenylalanine-4-hydroxylase [Flavobacteriales bacterium]